MKPAAIAKLFEGWFRLKGQKWHAVGDMPAEFQAKPDNVEDDDEEEEEEPTRPRMIGKQPPSDAAPDDRFEGFF